jgi:iron complex transport system permease protein
VAGALFQGVLRNPLADPYVIGTSAGAQLGVIIALSAPTSLALAGFGSVQLLAFAGALVTVLFVYALARSAGRAPVVTLLLAGFVVSSFLISATTVLMQMSGKIQQVTMWIMGSLQVGSVGQLATTVPLAALGVAGGVVLGAQLDVLALGEEQAAHLGVRVERLKLAAIVLASLLTALAVALAGIVAFVGLVVPHSARLLYGPRHRLLIVTSALCGSVFLILADLVARSALPPDEIPLGAVTAVVGAPFFLYLLLRARRDYGL